MSRQLLGFLLAGIAFVALGLAWVGAISPTSASQFGLSLAPAGPNAIVLSISPESQAARSGLQPGDVVDLSRLTYSERMRLEMKISPPGTSIGLSVIRGNERLAVVVRATDLRRPRNPFAMVPFLTSATIILTTVAVIAWRRPSIATAALVYVGTGALTTENVCGLFASLPNLIYGVVCFTINLLFASAPELAILPFIVRFPHIPSARIARVRMHAADALFAAGFIACAVQTLFEPFLFVSWNVFDAWTPWIEAAIILAFVWVVYANAVGEERRRIAWVIVGIIANDIGFVVFNAVDAILLTGAGSSTIRVVLSLAELTQIALPLTLGYAILRHRVIDTGFVLNRTAVYAATTTFVLAMVGLVDWLAGRYLSGQRFAVAVEAIITIGFGFALNALHRRTEYVVDRLIFRRRHLAEKRVAYRAAAISFAESTASVDEALVNDMVDILELSSAAVFMRASTSQPFRLNLARGWQPEHAVEIPMDSLLVRSLRALERPAFLDDLSIVLADAPQGAQRPVLAIPLVAQHDLVGIVLYGNGRDGASLDPEEVAMLHRIANAAAVAYGAVEARQWRLRAVELEETLRSFPPVDARYA